VKAAELPAPPEFGWQAVLFRTVESTPAERIVYMPVGWLESATSEELRAALEQAGGVRARWGAA
jgi:hypothetical protein